MNKRNNKMVFIIMLLININIVVTAAKINKQDFTVNRIVSVYDGDTFRTDLNCTEDFFCKNIPIRVYGVDTPEKRGGTGTKREKELAYKARKVTVNFLYDNFITNKIILRDCFRGKYFRLVCNVENKKGELLINKLLNSGLGVEYYGGTKIKDWSE